MSDNYIDIRGTSETILQIGIDGAQIKNNAGVLEAKNSDDSALARLKAAAPQSDDDVVNFLTFKTKKGNVIVKEQVDTSTAIPNNTAVERFLVVTTPGNGAVIGDLLYDDGSNSGLMTIIAKDDGRTIFTTKAMSGGNVELIAEAIYGWDETGGNWVLQSTVGDAPGTERIIEYSIATNATTDSSNDIPANAKIYRREVEITTVYPATVEMKVGHSTTDDLLIASTSSPKRINPQKLGTYIVTSAVAWGAAQLPVRTTLTNTPASGAAVVRVWYSLPNN
jgi:hypothetical protein